LEFTYMSNADKGGEQAGGFSDADKAVAQRALTVYTDEINDDGFRWELDCRPHQMAEFLGRGYSSPAVHAREIDGFVDRIRVFGGFLADLATFEDRPITDPHLMGWDETPGTVTRNIGKKELTIYSRLHGAVVDYAGALINHGPNSAEVAEAAAAAAQVVQPEAWREAGYPVPEDAVLPSQLVTRWYLEAVIHAPQEQ
jgi:hypothetical protein